MPSLRFHEAARDGILRILMEATEKDCNCEDAGGMTPVHCAAFCGQLSALRLLIGLGGKPSKYDATGNTALHHAAAGGHLKVVAFLVALGENPWELNAEFQNPKVVAARHGRENVLRYLDAFMGRQMASNRKKTLLREDKAKKRAMARFPSAQKVPLESSVSSNASTPSITPASSRRSSVSTMMGSTISIFRRRESTVSTSTKATRTSLSRRSMSEEGRAEGEEEEGEAEGEEVSRGKQLWDKLRNAKSPVYKKMRRKREEESKGRALKRGDSADPRLEESSVYFGSSLNMSDIQRSMSQPDIYSLYSRRQSIISCEGSIVPIDFDGEDEVFKSQNTSMFERPGFGKVAFRQNSVIPPATAKPIFNNLQQRVKKRAHSVGGFEDGTKGEGQIDDEEELSSLDAFLVAWGLSSEGPALHRAGFQLETLMNAEEEDLKNARIPLGPRKKLMNAIEKRRAVIESPSIIVSRL